MDIIPRTATVVESASTQNITGTRPTDRQSGDLVVAVFVTTGSPAQFTGPGGSWVALFSPFAVSDNNTVAAYYQFDPGSDPTVSTSAAANRASAICQAYGGVHTSTPIDVTTATAATAPYGTSLAVGGIITVTDGARLISGCALDSSTTTLTVPAGMTTVGDATGGGVGRGLTVADEVDSTAGPTGTRTWSHGSGDLGMGAFLAALRPAPDVPTVVQAGQAATQEAIRRRMSAWPLARLLRAPQAPATVDATVSATFGVSAAATREAFADGSLSATFGITASATVTSRLFTNETLEIEFTPGVWTDVTEDWIAPLLIRQARPTPFDEIGGGSLETRLHNVDGRYLANNPLSPYFPNVRRNVRVRWRITKGENTYTRFVGWIQSWKPSFPNNELRKGVVDIVAVDALGLLAQRKLRSNFTEKVLQLGRADSVSVDVWEATGKANGMVAFLTNYSEDASPASPSAGFNGTFPTLTFSDDQDLSCGQVVSTHTGSGGYSCKTSAGFQASPLQIIFHFKTPADLLDTQHWTICTLYDSVNAICNLIISQNGSDNGLFLMNANLTVNLGIVANLPRGQWVKIKFLQNATTATHLDVSCTRFDGTATGVTDVNLDIRDTRWLEIPGGISVFPSGSWGGIAGLGTRTSIALRESYASGSGATLSQRVTAIADACDALPVTISTIGTLTAAASTGRWSDRYALGVLQEVLRTTSGIAWARSRDSEILALGADQLYPDVPVVTVDVNGDCIGPPTLVDASMTRPTRVDVEWPGGVATAIDRDAEANGEVRSARTSTVATSDTAALSVGQAILARSATGLRISKIVLDMNGAVNDPTAALFDETGAKGGLYPTQRIRVLVPSWYFGVSHMDVHVEGWTEVYGANNEVRLQLDTSPAIDSTAPPVQLFGDVAGSRAAVVTATARRVAAPGRALIVRGRG